MDSAAIKVNGQQVVDISQLKSPDASTAAPTGASTYLQQKKDADTMEEKKVQASDQMTTRDVKEVWNPSRTFLKPFKQN
jgi:hypothetical protein